MPARAKRLGICVMALAILTFSLAACAINPISNPGGAGYGVAVGVGDDCPPDWVGCGVGVGGVEGAGVKNVRAV